MEQFTPEKLRELWNEANSTTPEQKQEPADDSQNPLQEENIRNAIHEFCKYISIHLVDLNFKQLRERDLPIIRDHNCDISNWREHHLLLSSSGVTYMKMTELFSKICEIAYPNDVIARRSTTFIINVNHIPLTNMSKEPLLKDRICRNYAELGINKDNVGEYEVMMERMLLIFTAMGNKNQFPLIEQIYEISTKYTYDDNWQIVKYQPIMGLPPSFVLPVPSQQAILTQEGLKYSIQNESLVISFDFPGVVPSDFIAMRDITSGHLVSLFGEYVVAHRIREFNIIPYHFLERIHPAVFAQLQDISELYKLKMDDSKKCQFCNLRDYNCEFKTIDHSKFNDGKEDCMPEGNYCSYCFGRLGELI